MLNDPTPPQTGFEFVNLEDLVPKDHLLRQIDRAIDFSFIHPLVSDLYCSDNGRPALDPTLMFKALLLGYLFGIRSERQLVREIEVNLAYRWFLGLGITEPVFDASTLSQNRRRRFEGTSVHQDIFDEIVEQAIRAGFVEGTVLYTDSTHLKASANKNRYDKKIIAKSRSDYWEDLDKAVKDDRVRSGKTPLKDRPAREPVSKETKVSPVDPDAGYMVRDGKPKGFFYLDHRTVDGKLSIITDTYLTPANVHDSIVYLDRLDRQRKRFELDVGAVGLDAGYATTGIAKGLEDRQIWGVTGYRRPNKRKGFMPKRLYTYDAQTDTYTCPQDHELTYRTTDRRGYRMYASDPKTCKDCPVRDRCTASANMTKIITRHVWQDIRDKVDSHRLTPWGKAIYKRRKETVERSFANAKQLHGHRYARFRGVLRMREQCLLAATAQNIKTIARAMAKNLIQKPPASA